MNGITVKYVVTKFVGEPEDDGEKYAFDNINEASEFFFKMLSEHPDYTDNLLTEVKKLYDEQVKTGTNEELTLFMEAVSSAELNRSNRVCIPIGVGYIEKVALYEECGVNIIDIVESNLHPSVFHSILSAMRVSFINGEINFQRKAVNVIKNIKI